MDTCRQISYRAAYEKFGDGDSRAETQVDVSFKLPQGWAWAMLGEVAEIQLGKMLDKKNTVGNLHPYLANVSVRWGSFDLGNLKQMPFSHSEVEKFALKLGDIIMCEGGVPGRCAVWREEADNIKYQKALHRIRLYETSPEFVRYYFEAIHDTMFFTARFSGSTIHHLPRETLIQVPIPLPPIAEQKRIVAKIEELFAIADSLGEAADNLESVAKRLDKKILNLAIRGKLVPQDPNDEPASELVKRIAASHKSPCKNQSETIDPPFAIPQSWEWVRLGEVSDIVRGTGIKRNETTSVGIQCVRYGEIYTHYGESFAQTFSFVPKAVADKCHDAKCGDVLCTLTGENEVEIAKATAYTGKERLVIGGDLARISNHPYDPMLLVYFMFSPFMISQKASVCTGGMIVHMGKSALSNLYIPLPPLAEQKRIVAKIEELRAVIKPLTM